METSGLILRAGASCQIAAAARGGGGGGAVPAAAGYPFTAPTDRRGDAESPSTEFLLRLLRLLNYEPCVVSSTTAIGLSELCGLNLVSELHVMRKQYLDGSIPTGFQRTAMVGLGGILELAQTVRVAPTPEHAGDVERLVVCAGCVEDERALPSTM